MKKSDLKDGMIVVTRDGAVRIVLGNTLVGSFGGVGLSSITDDLQSKYNYKWTIDRVYIVKKHSRLHAGLEYWFGDKNVLDYCELVWDRHEYDLMDKILKRYLARPEDKPILLIDLLTDESFRKLDKSKLQEILECYVDNIDYDTIAGTYEEDKVKTLIRYYESI